MKKVMMALPELEVGGAQIFTVNLIREIRKRSSDIEFQILLLESPHGSWLEKMCQQEKIDVIYLGKEKGLHLQIIPQIMQAIKAFKPDVIHMHKSRMHYFLLPILLGGVEKRLYTVHNLAEMDTPNKWLRKLLFFAFHYCRIQPVAISDLCRKSIVSEYTLKEESVPCIYVGIDTAEFQNPNQRCAPEKGRLTFVSVGRICAQKNYSLLIRSAAKVHEQWPEVEFIILGDGELRDDIEGQIKNLSGQNYIHLLGNVNDVYHYLWKADAYLMASDYEGLPQTVLEAMAAGLPIISTKAGGVVDVVRDGENGFLVECGDEDGLIAAMESMIQSPSLCERFSEKSIELSKNFTIENCAASYEALYLS